MSIILIRYKIFQDKSQKLASGLATRFSHLTVLLVLSECSLCFWARMTGIVSEITSHSRRLILDIDKMASGTHHILLVCIELNLAVLFMFFEHSCLSCLIFYTFLRSLTKNREKPSF